ncbi:MAG: pyridoxal phosphate-dependent aminotransferase [Candidatus Omnitrophota bacterium]
MLNFSKRTHWQTAPNRLAEKIAELKTRGVPLTDLTISNPTLCGFDYLKEDLLRPFLDPKNLHYDPDPHGLLRAREALCRHFMKEGVRLSPEQIFLTANTSEAYTFIYRLLCEPGDAVLAPQPGYPILEYLAGINDLETLRYPITYENGGWGQILQSPLIPKEIARTVPKILLLVNPNNPTGNYVTEDEWRRANDFCAKNGAAVLSDEVFFEFPLEKGFPPKRRGLHNEEVLTFTLGGISKFLGLPQMKLSWIIITGPEKERKETIRRLEILSDTYLSAGTPIQNALGTWFEIKDRIQKEILERIRNNYAGLERSPLCIPGMSSGRRQAEGGWNVVLKMPEEKTDEEWALHFLEKHHALLHPGYLFDFEGGPYLVCSLLIKRPPPVWPRF